jgi:hypothetical protein
MSTQDRDYIRDIAEIRSMMEKSSKFLSLSGWAGIMAGIYALAGTWIAYSYLDFYPTELQYSHSNISGIVLLSSAILTLALGTALLFSQKQAAAKGESAWNATSRRMLAAMAAPLVTGGALILILISAGLTGLAVPLTLIFYGLALYNAGSFTLWEVKGMGLIQIILGLAGTVLIEHSLLFWAIGFGIVHIIYGMYIHLRYER